MQATKNHPDDLPPEISAIIAGLDPDDSELRAAAAAFVHLALKGGWGPLAAFAVGGGHLPLLLAVAAYEGVEVVQNDDGSVEVNGEVYEPVAEPDEPGAEARDEKDAGPKWWETGPEGESAEFAALMQEPHLNPMQVNRATVLIMMMDLPANRSTACGLVAAKSKPKVDATTLKDQVKLLMRGATRGGQRKAQEASDAAKPDLAHPGTRDAMGEPWSDRSGEACPKRPDFITRLGGLSELRDRWVFSAAENAAFNVAILFENADAPLPKKIGIDGLRGHFAGEARETSTDGGKDGPKKVNPVNLWITGDKLTTADKPVYDASLPGGFHDGLLNFCVVPKDEDPDAKAEDVEPFLALIDHLIPDDEQRRWVIESIAHKWQFPHERGPLLIWETPIEGTGRGTLEGMMSAILGRRNVRMPSADDLLGRGSQAVYNDWVLGLLGITEEMPRGAHESGTSNDINIIDRMKTYVDPAPKRMTVAEKFGPKIEATVYMNIWVFTQRKNVLPYEKESRRLANVTCTQTPLNPATGKKWAAWARRPESARALRGWLRKVKLTSYVHNAPPPDFMRRGLVEGAAESRSMIAEDIEDVIDAYRETLRRAVRDPDTDNVIPLGADGQPEMTPPPESVWVTEIDLRDWAKAQRPDWKADTVERQVRAWVRNQTSAYAAGSEGKAWRPRGSAKPRLVRPRIWPRTAKQSPDSGEVIAQSDAFASFLEHQPKKQTTTSGRW